MAWLWGSWEEYLDAVNPVVVKSRGVFGWAEQASRFVTIRLLYDALVELNDAIDSLRELGFTGEDHRRPPQDASVVGQAEPLIEDVVYAGETLLLYHKRLAKSKAFRRIPSAARWSWSEAEQVAPASAGSMAVISSGHGKRTRCGATRPLVLVEAVPRHSEVADVLARKIRRNLSVPDIGRGGSAV